MAQATGNFPGDEADYPGVICEDVRMALSARLDGEGPGAGVGEVAAHLAGCAGCAAWVREAERLTEAVRLAAPEPPDRTEPIMAAVAADPVRAAGDARRRAAEEVHGRWQVLRVSVALAALVQLALAVPALAGAALVVSAHTGREMASFDVAVAVGFLAAAYRPARARAFVPVALVLAVLLGATSAVDMVRGAAGFGHEAGHLVAVIQAGLLWALSRIDAGAADRVPRPRVAGTPR